MGRSIRKTTAAERKAQREKDIALIYAALDNDFTSRRDIQKATGMNSTALTKLFLEEKKVYAAYTVRRRMLVDMAADNIQDIVNDPDHPNHFAASKYVLQKYKSDLDTVLESHEKEEVQVEIGGSGNTGASPITIKFGQKKE